MAAVIQPMWPEAYAPTGRRIVIAASGPYEAEPNASRPRTGMPVAGPTCSTCSSSVRRGFPNNSSFSRTAQITAPERTFNPGQFGCQLPGNWSATHARARRETLPEPAPRTAALRPSKKRPAFINRVTACVRNEPAAPLPRNRRQDKGAARFRSAPWSRASRSSSLRRGNSPARAR